jgi:hypothetical protein
VHVGICIRINSDTFLTERSPNYDTICDNKGYTNVVGYKEINILFILPFFAPAAIFRKYDTGGL